MKKTLVALAALAATGAFAQVTITGALQMGFERDLSGSTANVTGLGTTTVGQVPPTGLAQGMAIMDGTFEFHFVDDLGGGNNFYAMYSLDQTGLRGIQNGIANDRRIGIKGSWGDVRIAFTRSSDLLAGITSTAISLPDGLYDSSGILARGNIDVLSYTSPVVMGGFQFSAGYAELVAGHIDVATSVGFGTRDSTSTAAGANAATSGGTYALGAGVAYTQGPLVIQAAYKFKNEGITSTAAGQSVANLEASMMYDLGWAKLNVGFDGPQNESTGTALAASKVQSDQNALGLSLTAPISSVISVGAETYKRGDNSHTSVGGMYALSKRTMITAAIGNKTFGKNGGIAGAAASGGSGAVTAEDQYRLSVRHTF